MLVKIKWEYSWDCWILLTPKTLLLAAFGYPFTSLLSTLFFFFPLGPFILGRQPITFLGVSEPRLPASELSDTLSIWMKSEFLEPRPKNLHFHKQPCWFFCTWRDQEPLTQKWPPQQLPLPSPSHLPLHQEVPQIYLAAYPPSPAYPHLRFHH